MLGLLSLCRLEWRRVRRDRAVMVTVVGFVVSLMAGVVVSRAVDMQATAAHEALRASATRAEAGLRQQLKGDDRSSDPVWTYYITETAILPSRPLSWLSLGSADLQPTVARLAVYSDPLALFDEPGGTRNPTVLAAGRFDVAFVLIWVLPLAVIATTFGVLSVDRESGVLLMTLSQPVTRRRLATAAVIMRAGVFAVIAIGVVGGAALMQGPWSAASLVDSGLASLAILSYVSLWAALSCLVNLASWSSATNASVLGIVWLASVALAAPAIASITSIVAPANRAAVAARAQGAYSAAAASGQRLIDEYYAAHPTFDRTVAQGLDVPMREFWVVLDRRAAETAPAIEAYERARAWRTRIASVVQVVIPPVALQRALDHIAGNDDERFYRFSEQVRGHFRDRQAQLVPWLFQSHALTLGDLDALLRFVFQDRSHIPSVLFSVGSMTLLAALLWASASAVSRRS